MMHLSMLSLRVGYPGSRHVVALLEAKFQTRGTRGTRADIILDRNAKWDRKLTEFPNLKKKRQPREVDRNFRNDFPEISSSIRF